MAAIQLMKYKILYIINKKMLIYIPFILLVIKTVQQCSNGVNGCTTCNADTINCDNCDTGNSYNQYTVNVGLVVVDALWIVTFVKPMVCAQLVHPITQYHLEIAFHVWYQIV